MQANTSTETYQTAEVAEKVGVHKDTLLRWLRSGLISEPSRDRRGWRIFSESEIERVIAFANSTDEKEITSRRNSEIAADLSKLDWNFTDAKTLYLSHGIHPYPAKYIPQIPNALIQELSSVGDTVGDIFCGSGTTLVEALLLKRHAVGIDANPLACMVAKAKTSRISEYESGLLSDLVSRAREFSASLSVVADNDLFSGIPFLSSYWRPETDNLLFWFNDFVVEELAELLAWCRSVPTEVTKTIALTAFSSIVVRVSKQDSDTRYVRREKNTRPGDAFKLFASALESAISAALEIADLIEPRFQCTIENKNLLASPKIPQLDLIVCSPPYPNAYSYHLYHMTRMMWLQMDQPTFKQQEIGSHRKYSSKSKNAATVDTFKNEFQNIFKFLSRCLNRNGHACFVIGDSTIRGKKVDNTEILSSVGRERGFEEVCRLSRELNSNKKSFNPKIGKIRTETILVMSNDGRK